jgi:hypothetical protein
MDGLTLLLLGGILGLLLTLLRPQTLVVPPVVTPLVEDRGGGCLGMLALVLILVLGLLLLVGAHP